MLPHSAMYFRKIFSHQINILLGFSPPYLLLIPDLKASTSYHQIYYLQNYPSTSIQNLTGNDGVYALLHIDIISDVSQEIPCYYTFS